MLELQVVGRPIARTDGPAKVSGRAEYTADVALPGTVWGQVLRSPVAHARVISIEAGQARALPGVHAVLTAHDLPDPGRLVGRRLRDFPILALDRVLFIGQPVAAVAAESLDVAEAALELIEVEYEELPPVFDPAEALTPEATVLHPRLAEYVGLSSDRPADAPANLQGIWSRATGDVEAGFAEADVIVEGTYSTPPVHQGYLEPHAVLAQAQPDGSIDMWLSNKTPFAARGQLAAALDVRAESVRVHPAAIGGDFGGKGSLMVAPIAALLSRACGRPVRMVMSYVEELMAGNPRHAARIRLRAGARRDGTLTALEAEMVLDGGAYAAFKPAPTHIVGGIARIAGPYRIPNVRLEGRVAYTNTVPRGHMRAPGEPQAVFARELHLDVVARRLGIDPLELRRRNLLAEGEEQPAGGRWTHPTASIVIDRAAEAVGWGARREPNVGRGLAVSERGIGTGHSTAILWLETDGSAELLTGLFDTGTGAHTMMQQVAAEELGLDPSRVRVRIGGTDEAEDDSGAGGSRVTHVAGQAAYQAAASAAQQLTQLAAERYPENSFAAQAAEVEVDPETGQVRVRRLVSVHDVGTVINPIAHDGQIEGGAIQALGFALMEEVTISPDEGRVATLSLGEYKLPTVGDAPPFETLHIPGGRGPAPYGGKAIGEASSSALAPAIAAAVLDAVGVVVGDLPITAEKVRAGLASVPRE